MDQRAVDPLKVSLHLRVDHPCPWTICVALQCFSLSKNHYHSFSSCVSISVLRCLYVKPPIPCQDQKKWDLHCPFLLPEHKFGATLKGKQVGVVEAQVAVGQSTVLPVQL